MSKEKAGGPSWPVSTSSPRKATRRREEHRQEWRDFHRHMQALHADLAVEHRSKAQRLLKQDERKENG